jgi:hypothetical protein
VQAGRALVLVASAVGLVGLFGLAGSCSQQVALPIPETTIPGDAVLASLWGRWMSEGRAPEPLRQTLSQSFGGRDVSGASTAQLTSLMLWIATGSIEEDFDWLEGLQVFIRSRRGDPKLPRILIAEMPRVPRRARVLALDVEPVELLPYVEQGAWLETEVKARPPRRDVKLEGAAVLLVSGP